MIAVCFVFFFKQKTAYEMRISDWSSDVCSSELLGQFGQPAVVDRRDAARCRRRDVGGERRTWRFAEASLGLADRQELGQRRHGIQHAARAPQYGAGVAVLCTAQASGCTRKEPLAAVGGGTAGV